MFKITLILRFKDNQQLKLPFLSDNDFLKSAAWLFSANSLSQLLLFAASIWLARLYPPAAFGYFATFLSVANVLGIVSTGRYDVVIPLPKFKRDYLHVFWLSLFIIGFFLLAGLLSISSAWLLGAKLAWSIIGISLLTAIMLGYMSSIKYFWVQKGKFSELASLQFAFSLAITAGQLLLASFDQERGMIYGYVLGSTLTLGIATLFYFSSFRIRLSTNHLKKMARYYWPIVRWSLPSGLLNSVTSNLQPIVMATAFGAAEAGWYFLAYKVAGTPLQALSSAISQVYFKKANQLYLNQDRNALLRLSLSVSGVMFIAALLIGVFLIVFGEHVFIAVFGMEWEKAAHIARWITLLLLGKFAFHPISALAEILGKTKWEFSFNLVWLLYLILTVAVGWGYQDYMIFIKLMVLGGVILYAFLWLQFIKAIRGS
jgi:O-antigen/teichoic acid export membrane protein